MLCDGDTEWGGGDRGYGGEGTSRTESHTNLGDLCPSVAEDLVGLEDGAVLEVRPGRLADVRIEVVVPSLAALLPDASGQVRRDERPALRAVLAHETQDSGILLLGGGGAGGLGQAGGAGGGKVGAAEIRIRCTQDGRCGGRRVRNLRKAQEWTDAEQQSSTGEAGNLNWVRLRVREGWVSLMSTTHLLRPGSLDERDAFFNFFDALRRRTVRRCGGLLLFKGEGAGWGEAVHWRGGGAGSEESVETWVKMF